MLHTFIMFVRAYEWAGPRDFALNKSGYDNNNCETLKLLWNTYGYCEKFTYFGAYLLKRTTFRPLIYRSWSHTGVTCVGSDFGGIIWL